MSFASAFGPLRGVLRRLGRRHRGRTRVEADGRLVIDLLAPPEDARAAGAEAPTRSPGDAFRGLRRLPVAGRA